MKVSGIPYVQGGNSYADADGTKYGIAIHNTSNTAPATAEASYARTRPDGVSSHFYCDATQVIQSLDTTARAGHAGSSQGNQNAVAVEITGTNDKSRAWWLANVAWDVLGRVLAEVCHVYGISVRRASVAEMQSNPKVRAFYSHDDMRRAWGGTTHDDPGPNFPWDRLFTAVTGTEDDMTPDQDRILRNLDTWLQTIGSMAPTAELKGPDGSTSKWPNKLAPAVTAGAVPIDLPALAAALAPLLDESIDASAVLGVLESEAGQAALTGAANRAEDS